MYGTFCCEDRWVFYGILYPVQKGYGMRNFKKKPVFAGFGEVLYDCLPEGERLGGAPANFAWIAHELGMDAMVISAVGNDERGKRIQRELKERGLPFYLSEVPHTTGYVEVQLEKGIPSYHFAEDSAYRYIPWSEELKQIAETVDVVCFGTMAGADSKSGETLEMFLQHVREGVIRLFDVNLRGDFYSEEQINRLLPYADIVKCNNEELPWLAACAGVPAEAETYASWLASRGIRGFICTRGDKDSMVFWEGNKTVIPSEPVRIKDTVGAGDSFAAAFTAALMQGKNSMEAHKVACRVSAWVCTFEGAMPDLRSFIHKGEA